MIAEVIPAPIAIGMKAAARATGPRLFPEETATTE